MNSIYLGKLVLCVRGGRLVVGIFSVQCISAMDVQVLDVKIAEVTTDHDHDESDDQEDEDEDAAYLVSGYSRVFHRKERQLANSPPPKSCWQCNAVQCSADMEKH